MFRQIGEAVLDLVYPRFCIGCKKSGVLLCHDCFCEIDFYFMPIRLQLDPIFIDQYLVVARLEGIVRKLVHQLKYNGVKELATVAGELLYLCSEWPDADLVTAVPLHKNRLGERGYNQAALIGQSFADRANLPYVELLKRTVNTPHQAQQETREDRAQNLTNHFALIQSSIIKEKILEKHIIIVDDVCTTGITLNHCAKVLKDSGCKTITALTLAHGR
ncbi:ComF family protein [Candidatus Woesebacteria bacterium]|nr:ComF family protein [Candidatus Woesebacteria bacterium]